jgi:hypothetical protein
MVATLKPLKLFGMAHAVDELATQGSPAYATAQAMQGGDGRARSAHCFSC